MQVLEVVWVWLVGRVCLVVCGVATSGVDLCVSVVGCPVVCLIGWLVVCVVVCWNDVWVARVVAFPGPWFGCRVGCQVVCCALYVSLCVIRCLVCG